MTDVALVLRETTLPRLLWRAWRGEKPLVAWIDAITSPGTRLLTRLLRQLRRRGLVLDLAQDRPELVHYNLLNEVLLATDSFFATEPWQAERYRFSEADRALGDYADVYRDLCSGHVQKKLVPLFYARDLAAVGIAVEGASSDIEGLYRARFDEAPPAGWRWSKESARLINLALAAVAALFAVVDIARRIRPFQKPEGHYFLGSDFADDARDQILWRDIDDAPGPVMAVFRSDAQAAACRGKIPQWDSASANAGRFPVRGGLAAMAEAITHIGRLWRWCDRLAPELFFTLVLMPVKRMRIRALLTRWRFDNFWCRDDYNTEHMLRSQELRRLGGKSIGISHGYHVASTVLQQTRYIDYDTYFCFGLETCRKHIAATWPRHMRLRNMSSFAFSRDDLKRVAEARGPDIMVLPQKGTADSQWWTLMRRLAETFPERRILFNVKESRRTGVFGAAIEAFLADCPPNVEEYRSIGGRSTYDLMYRCSYLVSDGTTMLVEAVQVGMHGIGANLDPGWTSNPMRDLPGLFVKTVDEAIARIQAIEAGTYRHPYEQWAGDIELAGRVIWDQFREELGLPPKGGDMGHLRFLPQDPEPTRTCA